MESAGADLRVCSSACALPCTRVCCYTCALTCVSEHLGTHLQCDLHGYFLLSFTRPCSGSLVCVCVSNDTDG